MSPSSRVLFLGGWLIALVGMSYGLWYALFDEHQTLQQIGMLLAQSFTQAARNDLPAAHASLAQYAQASAEYTREVHAHSHWILLSMVMIALGLVFDRVNLTEKLRYATAWLMCTGAFVFPAAILLKNFMHSAGISSLTDILAIAGAGAVILALAISAAGLLKGKI